MKLLSRTVTSECPTGPDQWKVEQNMVHYSKAFVGRDLQ